VKFYDVKSKIFNTKAETSESDLLLDDEDDSWLDQPLDTNFSASDILHAEEHSTINLQSKALSTFLSSDDVQPVTEEVQPSKTQMAKPNFDDNDFSMTF
jgi:hypothetical protein